MAKFINPFSDIGFKRIFGQEFSKPLLMSFLNSLLVGEKTIVDITFLDKEQPAIYDEDRSLIYDIYCKTTDDEHIIVEMQNREQPYFKKRSVYYISEAISRQGERGAEWRYAIKAVYLVAFLNFSLPDIGDSFRTDVALMDMKTGRLFSNDLRLIYLQLPHFVKEVDECDNDFDRWIYVLKNMEALNRLPWAAKNSVFERLSQIADISSLSKEERMKYDEGIRKYRDTLCVMDGAYLKGIAEGMAKGIAEGMEKGIAEGMEKGIAEGVLQTARNLKNLGFNISDIQKATGLPEETIKGL